MSSDASKQQSNVPAQAPHHEMRNAENSATFLLPRLRLMTENNPHLTLLDVGAGSGTITATLAKLIPGGRVIALDINPKILPRAQAVAEQAGVHNIKFQEGDVHRLSSFADNTFDVTFCHQVLTHVGAPWDALREMLRVTKPGGIVAVREGDFETESVWPELPGLLKFHRFVADSMKAAGGTSTAGRQLVSWALRAGGVTRDQIALSFSTWSYHSPSERATWGRYQLPSNDSTLLTL